MTRSLLLVLALAVALVSVLWLWAGGGDVPYAPDGLHPKAPPAAGQAGGTSPPSVEAAPEPEARTTEPPRQPPPPRALRLCMVHVDDGRPLAGIRAWVGTEALTASSGGDGWLELVVPAGQRVTFWGQGWIPAEFRSRALPDAQVELSPADASLEVLVDELLPDEGIVHSRLEPLDWTAPSGAAWAGLLEATGPDRLFGEGLAPGRYQLHVWIGPARSAGIPLEAAEVELSQGLHAVVRIDASVRPDDEVDR